MITHRVSRSFVVAVSGLLPAGFASNAASAQVPLFEEVAVAGDRVAGVLGAEFAGLGRFPSGPAVSAGGGVTLFGTIAVDRDNLPPEERLALLARVGGGLRLLAGVGSRLDDLDRATISELSGPLGVSDAGAVLFNATLEGPGVVASNDRVLVFASSGRLETVVRTGAPAPGAGGDLFDSVTGGAINDSERIAFGASLRSPESPPGADCGGSAVFFAADGAAPRLIAREGGIAPGSGGEMFSCSLSAPQIDDRDSVLIAVRLESSVPGSETRQALYAWSEADGLAPVAIDGQVAPGVPGFEFAGFSSPVLDPRGDFVVGAGLRRIEFEPGAEEFGSALYVGDAASDAGSLRPVLVSGDRVPDDRDEVFVTFIAPTIGGSGAVAFAAIVERSRDNAGALSSKALFLADGEVIEIARDGEPAPGADGAVFDRLGTAGAPSVNESGDVAFIASLRDITGDRSGRGLFVYDRAERVTRLLVREGGLFERTGGETATIGRIAFSSPRGPRVTGLGDGKREVAYSLAFDDGSSGVFRTALPLPCSAADLGEPFGSTSSSDIGAFLGLFFEGSFRAASLAEPAGVASQADVAEFVRLFFEGCGN
ncbi:MAG: choice-of-anchor tandem repeat NxxGxxAF-containing protein [Planctomycetota bacterium]